MRIPETSFELRNASNSSKENDEQSDLNPIEFQSV
jgi:hypothetical protein